MQTYHLHLHICKQIFVQVFALAHSSKWIQRNRFLPFLLGNPIKVISLSCGTGKSSNSSARFSCSARWEEMLLFLNSGHWHEEFNILYCTMIEITLGLSLDYFMPWPKIKHSVVNTSFFLFLLKATGTLIMTSCDGNGAQYYILQNPGSFQKKRSSDFVLSVR